MNDRAGPILQAGELGRAVALAIFELDPGAEVLERGAEHRVRVGERRTPTPDAAERIGGQPVELPLDLESGVPAFAGRHLLGAGDVQARHEVRA